MSECNNLWLHRFVHFDHYLYPNSSALTNTSIDLYGVEIGGFLSNGEVSPGHIKRVDADVNAGVAANGFVPGTDEIEGVWACSEVPSAYLAERPELEHAARAAAYAPWSRASAARRASSRPTAMGGVEVRESHVGREFTDPRQNRQHCSPIHDCSP